MSKLWGFLKDNFLILLGSFFVALLIGLILLFKLGSLMGGLSYNEILIIKAPYGIYDLLANPLNLHIDFIRSIVFYIAPDQGTFISRLPNALLGSAAIISFASLIWLWHGTRTSIFATLLFATSAWTLHVSRFASNDVLYLWAIPTLLLIQVLMHRWGEKAIVWYGSIITWTMMLFIPGMVWLVLLQIFLQRHNLLKIWTNSASRNRSLLSIFSIVIWLPLLFYGFTKDGVFVEWLGLPSDFPGYTIFKQFIAVFVHVSLRGPQYPDLWLDNLPIFDIFTLIAGSLGIYFYIKNWRASRSKTLGAMLIVSSVLVSLGGSFSLSAVVALIYIAVATGLALLLQEWLKMFPKNPFARFVGITFVTIAVILSCTYNLRSYFVAFPNYKTTETTFRYQL